MQRTAVWWLCGAVLLSAGRIAAQEGVPLHTGAANFAVGISETGTPVGYFQPDPSSNRLAAAVFEHGGVTQLPSAAIFPDEWSRAHEIDTDGTIYGVVYPGFGGSAWARRRAVQWNNGEVETLPLPAGHDASTVSDITTSGAVLGATWNSADEHGTKSGIVWAGGGYTQIMPPGVGTALHFEGMNAAGEIVGHYYLAGSNHVAFVWRDGVYTELPPYSGWTDLYAMAINDEGLIAGYGIHEDFGSPGGILWIGDQPKLVGCQLIYDVNDAGVAVGGRVDPGDELQPPHTRPCATTSTEYVELPLPPEFAAYDKNTRVRAINGAGTMVGDGSVPTDSSQPNLSFLWSRAPVPGETISFGALRARYKN